MTKPIPTVQPTAFCDSNGNVLGTSASPLEMNINATSVTYAAVKAAAAAADSALGLNGQNLTGVGSATVTGLTDSGLSSGRVVVASTGGLLSGDADLTFSGDTLTATNINSGTSGAITAGTGGVVTTGAIAQTNASAASKTIGVDTTAIAVGATGASLTTQAGPAGVADAITPAGASGAVTVSSRTGGAGSAAQAAGASGAVSLVSGAGGADGGGGGAASGDVDVDAGAATGAATAGIAKLGTTGASAVRIGRTTKTTTVYGALDVAEAATLDGNVTLGNASTDDVTITGSIAGNITFKKETARTISVAASTTTDTAGSSLTIKSADGAATNANSGDMTVDTGAKAGSGTNGTAHFGDTNANAVSVGRTDKVTTVNGSLAVTQGITANTVGKIFAYTDLAASGVGVHAAVAASAANSFPGPFTSPAIPRAVQIIFGAGWDGGDVTVDGTNWSGAVIQEVIADNPGNTVQGTLAFKTATAATKQTIGVSADTATIQTGDVIGVEGNVQGSYGLLQVDGTGEAVTVNATNDTFAPTTPPNGAHDYVLFVNVTHNHT